MKIKSNILILLVLFSQMCVEGRNDSTATITIHAKDYKNKTFYFDFSPKIRPSVTLDSNGNGIATIPITHPSFVNLGTNDSMFFSLLIDRGYDINYTIHKGLTKIDGLGSAPNNYFIQSNALKKKFVYSMDSIGEKEKHYADFINLVNRYEIRFKDFYTHFTDSVALPETISYVLRNSTKATVLLYKQKVLLSIDQRTIDSLNLYDRLGLLTNDIFSDTLLFKAQYLDFINFLLYNFEQTTANKLYYRYPEPNIYPVIIFNEINKSSKYSEMIKEFLLYSNIASSIHDYGINPTLENLCEVYYKMYPTSNYTIFLKKLFLKLNALSTGNIAPPFSGKTAIGQTISLNDFKGKVLLIDVWATWCGPCKTDLPYSHRLQKTLEKEKDFSVLYLSIDSDTTKWKAFLNKNKWLSGLHINIDDKNFKDSYKITGIPRYILIDKKGLIINAFCDKPSKGTIEDEIRKAL